MRLIGGNVYLGAINVNDKAYMDKLCFWLEDEEVVRYTGWVKTKPQTISEVQNYIDKLLLSEKVRLFGIYAKKKNKYIGNIRLDIEWLWRVGTISIFIGDKKEWGKGHGTEAINLITDFGFNTLNLHRIDAGILDGNIGSLKAFERAEFVIEGRQKDKRFNMGKYTDVIMVGKVNAIVQANSCYNTFAERTDSSK